MTRHNKKGKQALPTAGLIVEGDTEFMALPLLSRKTLIANCPPIRPINLGGVGSHLKPIGIAKMVVPKAIQHLVAGRRPVIVCSDREQRPTLATKLATEVLQEMQVLLKSKGYPSAPINVVVADRTFEAWLLADARGLHQKGKFQRKPNFHSFEGAIGKDNKKGLVELGDLLGRAYLKTTDGPRLFELLDFSHARKYGPNDHGSKSLDNFLIALGI